jgi:glutamate racemase
MSDSRPIGVFDSGAGGLSVLQELIKELPNESFIYFADSANCPYGSKSEDKIIELSSTITDFLIAERCKIIVVACNTATAAAIDWLRTNYDILFIGMEPAIKPAALNSITKSIGVLATAGTFKGRLYIETSHKYASEVNVCYQVGEGLVELVEAGDIDSHKAEVLLMKYLKPMLDCNIDHLVLGCTHYPFFKPLLSKILPSKVKVVDPAPAVAKQVKRVLIDNELNNTDGVKEIYIKFYSTSNVKVLRKLTSAIKNDIGSEIKNLTFFNNFILPNKHQ